MDRRLIFLAGSNCLKFKTTMILFLTKLKKLFYFTRCKLMDWSGVDCCDVFISCLDSHSDGTHSLQRIRW